MISAKCPQCGKVVLLDELRAGTTEVCAQCGATFTVQNPQAQGRPSAGPPPGYGPPPPPPGYQYYPPPYYYAPPPTPTNGNAIAALVLGVASIWMMCLGIILGPLAIHFAGKAKQELGDSRQGGASLANAGRICGIIGTILSVAIIVFYIIIFVVAFAAAPHSHHATHSFSP